MIDPKRQKPTSIGILPLQGDSASAHEAMTRELISLYIAGFDVIEVRGERISAEQRERVRQITQPLGLMVMRDLADLILLHNLLDATRLPVQQTLEQLYANAHSMLADALQSVRQGDRELARGIIARDKDVDCQFLMISRQFHRLLQDPLLAEQIGLSQTQLLHSYEVSRQLERVADHAVKIARQVERIESLRVSVSDTIQQVGASALHLVAEAWTSFSEHDRRRANRVLDECKKFEADALNTLLKHVAKAASPWLSIVADSINRVQDYGANIAETALNAAAAETMLHESLPGR
jgi:phosphate uptake regulator